MNKKGRGTYKQGARPTAKSQQGWSGKGSVGTGHTFLVLAAILFLAFFLRSFFAYGTAIGNGFALSGGADAVYYERLIEYILATGQQLLIEPLHNYPHEANNLREPLYAWAVVMGGLFLSLFGIPIDTAVGMSFMFSTPVFGTLMIIPVYLMAKEAFGARVGIIAAALLAVSSGAISLTVLSDADHDAMAMFFILWGFYFLMRAFEKVRGAHWVRSWRSKDAITSGLRGYMAQNRVSLLCALMAGMCLAVAAMTWKGFVYALVIITMFLIVQLLMDRFSNRDSMAVTMVFAVMGLSTVILSMPYYFGMNQVSGWWDLPLYIVLGGIGVGLYFTITRDRPWTLALPGFLIISFVGVLFLYVFMPAQFELLISGAGFFGGRSKLYGTIAEAQAPSFSALALSFGVTTLWLAIIGVFYAAVRALKVRQPFFVFIVVWMVVAMIMASSAQRFIFNSSMVFAIAAAVTLNIILSKVDLHEYWQNIRSAEWRSKLRRVIKPAPFVTVLFVGMLVATPNVWFAMDASIPNNTKADYDQQIYDGLPSFLKPDDYTHGDMHFLGSKGYRITTEDNWYYMNAWDWLSQQNNDIYPERDRPAYLSWWDYGFEAGHYGKHPTVAENFQRGYQMAAAFITAQSEEEAIALFIVRILETEKFSEDVKATLASHGVSVDELEDRIHNPSAWVKPILNNPDVYGKYSSDLSAANARYIASSHYLASVLGTNEMASLYHDIRQDTGSDIGYFAVDTRLFPWSVQNLGIFSAPALLGDHVMDQFGIPSEFYEIYAVVDGDQYVPLSQVTENMRVTDYVVFYKEKLYESMMWRAFMGFNPQDLGMTQQGIPGLTGSLEEYSSMQGWGLNHFRMVYRTAMYNPFDDYQNHSDAWTFVSYDKATELRSAINDGKATGVVDTSTSALRNGVAFIQYYDGVEISGQVTTEHGDPLEGVYVTVYDEYGIPHMMEETDSEGRYDVLAPFGDVDVRFSTGDYNPLMMSGANVLHNDEYTFTYSQAMRAENAVLAASAGHQVQSDVTLPSSKIVGSLKLDGQGMEGAEVSFVTDTATRSTVAAADGSYELSGLVPTTGRLVIEYQGHEVRNQSLSLAMAETKTVDVSIDSASAAVELIDSNGDVLRNMEVVLEDRSSSVTLTEFSDTDGVASFTGLLPGRYTMSLADTSYSLGSVDFLLSEGESKKMTMEVKEAMTLSGKTRLDNTGVGHVSVTFSSLTSTYTTMSAADGSYSMVLPKGEYTMHAQGVSGGKEMTALKAVDESTPSTYNIMMTEASVLRGTTEAGADLQLRNDDGAVLDAVASSAGNYRFAVPAGDYSLLASNDGKAWWNDITVSATTTKNIILKNGAVISGTVGHDKDGNGEISADEELSNVKIRVTDSSGRIAETSSTADGAYSFTGPIDNYVIEAMKDGYVTKTIDLLSASGNEHQDIYMVPENVTVSGYVDAAVTIEFTAVGNGAVSKSVTSNGAYSVSLRPGDYVVRVDQNAMAGVDTVRYEHDSELSINVGSAAVTHDVPLTTMIKTTVNTPQASDIVRISGYHNEPPQQTSYSIYLEEGEHSVYAKRSNTHAYMDLYDISPNDNTITVDMQPARELSGEVLYDGDKMTVSGDLIVDIAGAEMPFTVSDGSYSVLLPDGDYNLSFEFNTIEDSRHYVYSNDTSVIVSGATEKDLVMDRALNNVTLSYEVEKNDVLKAANVKFVANSASAIDASVANSASGSISLAPGEYTVYAEKDGDVFLGTIELVPFDDDEMTISLSPGLNLYGQFKASGVGVQADATIDDGEASMPLQNDASGIFDVYLPQGYYQLQASAERVERSVNVNYDVDMGVSLNSDTDLPIDMLRDDSRSAALSYKGTLHSVDPSKTFDVSVTVVNNGNVNETVTLSSNGWPMSFSENNFVLPYGQSNSKTVTVTVTAPADAAVEHGDVNVIARGADGTSLGTVTLNTAVTAQPDVTVRYDGGKTAGGNYYDYEVTLLNSGNVRDDFTLSVNETALNDQGWSVALLDASGDPFTSKELAAFADTKVTVRLTPISGMSQAEPSVTMVAQSSESSHSQTFTGSLPDVAISTDEVSVEGSNVFAEAGSIGTTTWVLLILSITSITLFIVIGMNRGVFTRRKR